MSKKIKTISELEQKPWFRFLKVVYIGALVLAIGLVLLITYASYGESKTGAFLWGVIIVGLLAWITRGSFYYIVLGKFSPKKKSQSIGNISSQTSQKESNNYIEVKTNEPSKFIANVKFKSTKNLATIYIFSVILVGLFAVTSIFTPLILSNSITSFYLFITIVNFLGLLGFFVILIAYLIWLTTSYRNLYAFNLKTKTTPGWVIADNFIPIISLFAPYKNMKEIWLGSQKIGTKTSSVGIVKLWWAVWIIAVISSYSYGQNNQYGSTSTNPVTLFFY